MKKALMISCFDWYKTRIEPIRHFLIDKGYDVTVLIADYDHIKKRPIEKKYPECTYVSVPQYKKNISFKRLYSHMNFGKSVSKELKKTKPDLIYLQLPPNNIARYCKAYKQKHPDTVLILDIIDLWPESMPLDRIRNLPPAKVWRGWRDNCIDAADHVFTECRLYQEKLNMDKSRTSTLHLFKNQTEEDKGLVEDIIKKREKRDDLIKFVYLGSMNNIIDIEGICAVIKSFIDKGYKCELHAIGDGESRTQFESAVKQTGCETFFYGVIFDEKEKIRILAPCDFAFNMMQDSITVGLTIKSIDYFSYGIPVINSIPGDTRELIAANGVGINVDAGKSIEYKNIDHEKVLAFFDEKFTKTGFEKAVADAIGNIV